MTWKDSDKVTTTYGSIKLAQAEAYDLGLMTERKAVLKFVNDAIDKNRDPATHYLLCDLLDKINETSKE
jgi:hypothetical protein